MLKPHMQYEKLKEEFITIWKELQGLCISTECTFGICKSEACAGEYGPIL